MKILNYIVLTIQILIICFLIIVALDLNNFQELASQLTERSKFLAVFQNKIVAVAFMIFLVGTIAKEFISKNTARKLIINSVFTAVLMAILKLVINGFNV